MLANCSLLITFSVKACDAVGIAEKKCVKAGADHHIPRMQYTSFTFEWNWVVCLLNRERFFGLVVQFLHKDKLPHRYIDLEFDFGR